MWTGADAAVSSKAKGACDNCMQLCVCIGAAAGGAQHLDAGVDLQEIVVTVGLHHELHRARVDLRARRHRRASACVTPPLWKHRSAAHRIHPCMATG